MAKCAYCGSTIIIGGVRSGDERFCNNKCQQNASALSAAKIVPNELLEKKLGEVWNGACPKCKGTGPVDLHKIHAVWSALVITRWTTRSQVSCRSCAMKQQVGYTFFSLICGWWGFPSGLILTPVQVGRNVMGMARGPDPSQPSENLRKLIRINLGRQIIASQNAATAPPATAGPGDPQPPKGLKGKEEF